MKSLTILTYAFGDGIDFAAVRNSIHKTWDTIGIHRTIIVSDALHEQLDIPGCTIQVDPSITDLHSMSLDMMCFLWKRFHTDYVLIIQTDGYPLRRGLHRFLGKYDFIGAPCCRDSVRWKANLAFLKPMNGGFSLRSRKMCKMASKAYTRIRPQGWRCIEDIFYTVVMPLRPWYRIRLRFPSWKECEAFSYDALYGETRCRNLRPFGFHRNTSLQYLKSSAKKEK